MTDRPTLLAVDDEPDILDYLERVFRKTHRVVRANNAAEALDLLPRTPVRLLVTDQRMPGMSGMELLERVAQDYPDVTRMLLSGFSDLPEITQASESGLVHAYVVKPVDSIRLREATAEAEARHRQGEWSSEQQ